MASIGIPNILIYLTSLDGTKFYHATLNGDRTYTFDGGSLTPTPIMNVPIGWDGIEIKYQRHPQYLGVFRTQSEQFRFIQDARAILLNLFYASNGGIQAQCMLRIDTFLNVNDGYETAYTAEIDFSTLDDEKQQDDISGLGGNSTKDGELGLNTLDSRLFALLEGYGGTQFNIPIFKNIGTVAVPIWITDASFVLHDGIKLLYNSTFTSSASVSNPLDYSGDTSIGGFNNGKHADSGPDTGVHTIPNLVQYNITQNNGATTFIGNDILSTQLIQGNQLNSAGASNRGETSFAGINNSQPYTRNDFALKNALRSIPGSVDMSVSITMKVKDALVYYSTNAGNNHHLSFVLFEVAPLDVVATFGANQYIPYAELYRINLPDNFPLAHPLILPNDGYIDTSSTPVSVTFNPDRVYILCLIYDNDDPTHSLNVTWECGLAFTQFQFSIFSKYDGGASGVPIPAPKLNASVFPAFRLKQLLQKIVPYLDTLQTDLYGFPIQIPTPFSGISDFLDSAIAVMDCAPKQIMITSAYCIHDLSGQSYITLSLNQLFNICKKVLGCGLAITTNSLSIEIEKLSKYFDAATEIFKLENNVSSLKIKPFNDLAGCNLKLGYTKVDTNSDFGIDSHNSELYFNTPLYKLTQTIDFEENEIVVDEYVIEKIRAQKTAQPTGQSFNPASPSSDNQSVAIYVQPTPTVNLPNVDPSTLNPYNFQPLDPSGNPRPCAAYQLTQRNGLVPFGGRGAFSPCAQNFDDTASTAPYIFGKYYPDSTFNLELSPCRALQRDGGALLHSVLDLMDEQVLTFRNTGIMQYNNVSVALGGISSNIEVGGRGFVGLVNEFSDKKISNLPQKLFRPFIFTITTVSPVNMYKTMKTNPNGYISFTWKGKLWKGFVWSISQKLSISQPTTFELIAHPETTNDQIINS